MKVIEMLGIQQGRKWGLATLNEFRVFCKLKPYTTFGGWTQVIMLGRSRIKLTLPYTEEVNSDKSVVAAREYTLCPGDVSCEDGVNARIVKALYGHPDNIELYPGILVEDAKNPMEPGSGLCPNFTVSFAILSDAVALVRGDRFYSADYGPSALTNFGYAPFLAQLGVR